MSVDISKEYECNDILWRNYVISYVFGCFCALLCNFYKSFALYLLLMAVSHVSHQCNILACMKPCVMPIRNITPVISEEQLHLKLILQVYSAARPRSCYSDGRPR